MTKLATINCSKALKEEFDRIHREFEARQKRRATQGEVLALLITTAKLRWDWIKKALDEPSNDDLER